MKKFVYNLKFHASRNHQVYILLQIKISGRFCFPRRNSGQTFIKNFLISGQVISGHYFLHELAYLAFFFSLQLTDTINNFEVILAARKEEYKKQFVKCFLNVIYFRYLEILHSSSFLNVSNFLVNHWTIFFLTMKTIFNWNFQSIATSTVQPFACNFNFN